MPTHQVEARRFLIKGAVQGVGFRPFVFRIAHELTLRGWVKNSPEGVVIEVEGFPDSLDSFGTRLRDEKPPHALIHSIEFFSIAPQHRSDFIIEPSDLSGEKLVRLLPDLALCSDCRRDMFDSKNRRHRYAFTNCTNCGPRFSIVESLPYDRKNTTMKKFTMCDSCQKEYNNPADRRFHAQPNACPDCGPTVKLWDSKGKVISRGDDALIAAGQAIKDGKILALKGIGGFQLIVDATNNEAVIRLRARKHRSDKPLAVMFPDVASLHDCCDVVKEELDLLSSAGSPIVLVKAKSNSLAPAVAPRQKRIGAMLPYSPLHAILLSDANCPLVATSGNLSDEPICIDEQEALGRLGGIADLFLIHNRPVVRPMDDSVFQVTMGLPQAIRLGRGYAPYSIPLSDKTKAGVAMGSHLKNTFTIVSPSGFTTSQHVGDMDSLETIQCYEDQQKKLETLYELKPEFIAVDFHPDYSSTRLGIARISGSSFPNVVIGNPGFMSLNGSPFATGRIRRGGLTTCGDDGLISIQHHAAHIGSVMAENNLHGRVFGVAWDGSGLGTDHTLWGGEFLIGDETGFERVGSLRPFPLPGGEKSVEEPKRSAFSLLWTLSGGNISQYEDLSALHTFTTEERRVITSLLEKGINSPMTTSMGRLFDAVASLIGLRYECSFEGQAAMELEQILLEKEVESYPFPRVTINEDHCHAREGGHPGSEHVFKGRVSNMDSRIRGNDDVGKEFELDWAPLIQAIIQDVREGVTSGWISGRFHRSLINALVQSVQASGEERVVLSGGCFQNKFLLEESIKSLQALGIQVFWNAKVPTNDGGLLGQAYLAVNHKGN